MAELSTLPAVRTSWPAGTGFATGRIAIGEIEVCHVSSLEKIWSCSMGNNNKLKGAVFYKPVEIPPGYFSVGHCSQGWVIVVKDISENSQGTSLPALVKPADYSLVWSSESWKGYKKDGNGFFWLPTAPQGYKAMGYLVTNVPDKPSLEEVRCVRSDLTGVCTTESHIWNAKTSDGSIQVWSTRPDPEKQANGVCAGTFHCSRNENPQQLLVACLINRNSPLSGMPSVNEVHSIMGKYGPTVFFHPKETYLPSSVSWFFKKGPLLCKKGVSSVAAEEIREDGSNLPQGGSTDGEYWIDLPRDDAMAKLVKSGDVESTEVYVHVKAVLGGTFTDIQMWLFYPFNGPATVASLGCGLRIPVGRIGEHVGDWEHMTLRVNNFNGELWGVYLSQHSGGEWVNAGDLEYVMEGSKKAVVYAARNGHANFSRAGVVLQGSTKLGLGIANESARSSCFVDTSIKYKIVSAEYLNSIEMGEKIREPAWLNYGRKWGPKIKYGSAKVLGFLKLPAEISGEDGPTGPKWKSSWYGDEKVKDVF